MDKNLIYLTQTDTTIGFLSNDFRKLNKIKQRKENKKTLQVVSSFKDLKQYVRVPKKFKRYLRNSKKTTFIYQNGDAFRVVNKKSDSFAILFQKVLSGYFQRFIHPLTNGNTRHNDYELTPAITFI